MKRYVFAFMLIFFSGLLRGQQKNQVSDSDMARVYQEIKTPFKYGLVLASPDKTKMMDSPSLFRKDGYWYMTYIVYDGKGYETWLAKSKNLLAWNTLGKLLSFGDSSRWDGTQKAGYLALCDYTWGGNYGLQKYDNKYWMSYLGGNARGYEAGELAVGMAYTESEATVPHEWQVLSQPVLKSSDADVRWWETDVIFKSSILQDPARTLGHPFVMYYNAKQEDKTGHQWTERIGMAVSDDMIHWKRFLTDRVMDHQKGITGDAVIQKIDNVWVMFYFRAISHGAFNHFACSYDLQNWTDWKGPHLIEPTEDYDRQYAHKSYVVKWKGVVYHFYTAVNTDGQRGLAVATSKDLGKSSLHFPKQ